MLRLLAIPPDAAVTALDQLRAVRELLTPEGRWLPGHSSGATDASGYSCPARSPGAFRFGVLGGLMHLAGPIDERMQAAECIRRTVDAKWIGAWEHEPGRTQAEVLEALDRAIDLAREGGRP